MELSTKLDGELEVREYQTPLLKLAGRWQGSVRLWKDKYWEVKGRIKAFQNAAADAGRSRDGWRRKAEQSKITAEQWPATAEQLQLELDRQRIVAAGTSDAASLPTKRTTAGI